MIASSCTALITLALMFGTVQVEPVRSEHHRLPTQFAGQVLEDDRLLVVATAESVTLLGMGDGVGFGAGGLAPGATSDNVQSRY